MPMSMNLCPSRLYSRRLRRAAEEVQASVSQRVNPRQGGAYARAGKGGDEGRQVGKPATRHRERAGATY